MGKEGDVIDGAPRQRQRQLCGGSACLPSLHANHEQLRLFRGAPARHLLARAPDLCVAVHRRRILRVLLMVVVAVPCAAAGPIFAWLVSRAPRC